MTNALSFASTLEWADTDGERGELAYGRSIPAEGADTRYDHSGLEGQMSQATQATHSKSGEASDALAIGRDRYRLKLTAAESEGRLAIFEWFGHSRGGPPLHVHPDQDEAFLVREGKYLFECAGRRSWLGPGDTIFLPRGAPHAFSQLSHAGRLLFTFMPAGDMEAFFAALASLWEFSSEPERERLFAAHGMRVIGPPLDPDRAGAAMGELRP